MSKIKVKTTISKKIYIHNDLMNAAFHLKEAVLRKKDSGGEGIGLDIMATLTMLAFAYEAKINFIGAKKVVRWKERDSFKKKSSKIYSALGLTPNLTKRPYSSVEQLKQFRNYIAHGKPIEVSETREEIVNQEDEFQVKLDSGYEEFCTVDNLLKVYDDVNKVWEEFLQVANIEIFETITSGSTDVAYIEHV